MKNEFYRNMRAYEWDDDNHLITGRFIFRIGGEMADGTKCWYKVGKDGELMDDTWYYMIRTKSGHGYQGEMIACVGGH